MDVENLEYIRSLDGLQIIGVFTVLLLLSVLTFKFKDIVKFFKKKQIEIDEVKVYKLKIKLVLKTMQRCKNMIIAITPESFNMKQRWIWDLILTKAFMGTCRDYTTGLALEKEWQTMSPQQFAEICQNEPKWVMQSVTQGCIDAWREDVFPMSFEDLSIHNRKEVGAKCVEHIIEHWTELRSL